ncbi:MAG: DUF2214 family protein [Burkholderiaceae bacterium]
MSAFAAFLHHLAAFTLVAALAVEFALLRGAPTAPDLRRLRLADAVYGVSAGVILVVGFLRVLYLEKGAAYYFHSGTFIAKLALFAVIGLLSIYPTMQFLRWGRAAGPAAAPTAAEVQRVRRLLHFELALLVPLILCAALMARGIGFFG